MNQLTGYLSTLNKAAKKYSDLMTVMKAGLDEYEEAFTPLLDDVNEADLKKIYLSCEGDKKGQFPTADLFVTICLILYSPEALYGGKLEKELAKKIAGVMGQTYNNVYLIRTKVSIWIRSYRGFLHEMDKVYDRIIGSKT